MKAADLVELLLIAHDLDDERSENLCDLARGLLETQPGSTDAERERLIAHYRTLSLHDRARVVSCLPSQPRRGPFVNFHTFRATPKQPAKWRQQSDASGVYSIEERDALRFDQFQTVDDVTAAVRAVAATPFLSAESRLVRRVEVHRSNDFAYFLVEGELRRVVLQCLPHHFAFDEWHEALASLVSVSTHADTR